MARSNPPGRPAPLNASCSPAEGEAGIELPVSPDMVRTLVGRVQGEITAIMDDVMTHMRFDHPTLCQGITSHHAACVWMTELIRRELKVRNTSLN